MNTHNNEKNIIYELGSYKIHISSHNNASVARNNLTTKSTINIFTGKKHCIVAFPDEIYIIILSILSLARRSAPDIVVAVALA